MFGVRNNAGLNSLIDVDFIQGVWDILFKAFLYY